MSYQPKPGSGSLFKNDRKEKDTHPDYRGDLCLPDGSMIRLAGWIKQGAKGSFLSLAVDKPREEQRQSDDFLAGQADRGRQGGVAGGDDRGSPFEIDDDSEIPF